jgi:hypothetical protein
MNKYLREFVIRVIGFRNNDMLQNIGVGKKVQEDTEKHS